GLVDGVPAEGAGRWGPGRHTVTEGAELTFPGGAHVPVVVGSAATGGVWLQPFSAAGHGPLATSWLVIATFLGTLGLPHVLVRFYTNRDGRAARRSAVGVLGLVGGFYVIAMLLGVLSRVYTPQLLITGDTDAAVLLVPSAVMGS